MENHPEPRTYIYTANFLGVFGTILNLYTLFLILYATPKSMKNYKYCLLFYQLSSWSFDTFIHSLDVEIYLPAIACRFYGIITFIPGIDMYHVLSIGFVLVSIDLFFTAQCFFYRHRQTVPGEHWMNISMTLWCILASINFGIFLGSALFAVSFLPFDHPPNASGLGQILSKYPAYSFLQTDPAFWIADDTALLPIDFFEITSLKGILLVVGIALLELLPMLAFSIGHSLCMLSLNSSFMSDARRRLQRRLLIALIWQALAPILTMAIPIAFITSIPLFAIVLPQEVINISCIIVTLHGKVSAILICFLTKPYRKFTKRLIKRILKIPIIDLKKPSHLKVFVQEIQQNQGEQDILRSRQAWALSNSVKSYLNQQKPVSIK